LSEIQEIDCQMLNFHFIMCSFKALKTHVKYLKPVLELRT